MPTRSYNQNTLYNGQWNVICDVCGFKFKSNDIHDRWDGLQVCRDDWEARHPMDFQRGFKDDQSVPYTRPDGTSGGTNADGTPIEGTTVGRGDEPGEPVPAALNITTTSLGTVQHGVAFSIQLETDIVLVDTFVWSIDSGSLPTGLSLGTATGIISGTPTVSGDYSVTVKIVDGVGRADTQAYAPSVGAGEPLAWFHPAGWVNANLTLPTQPAAGVMFDSGLIVAEAGGLSRNINIDSLASAWNDMTEPTNMGAIFGGVGLHMKSGEYLAVSNDMATCSTYNPGTDTWTVRANPPRAGRPQWQKGAAASVGGSTYVFGGFEGVATGTAHIQVFDETAYTWTLSASTLPINLYEHSAVTMRDGRILVGGGTSTGDNLRWWFFEPTTGVFTETTSIGASDHRLNHQIQVQLATDEVYFGGGTSAGSSTLTMKFNPTTEVWATGAVNLPVACAIDSADYRGFLGPDGNIYLFRTDALAGSLLPWQSRDTV